MSLPNFRVRPGDDFRMARTPRFIHDRRCLVPVVALSFNNVDSFFVVQRTTCEVIARNRLIELARAKKCSRPGSKQSIHCLYLQTNASLQTDGAVLF